MADETEIPFERFYDALDLMVQAGWVTQYARDAKNTAIQWTEHGKQSILGIYTAYEELGHDRLDRELWLSVAWIAKMRFIEGGPGFSDLGIRE